MMAFVNLGHEALYVVEGDEQPDWFNSQTWMECCHASAASIFL